MNEETALSTAMKYAGTWQVPWSKTVETKTHKRGFLIFKYAWAYTFRFESVQGKGEIHVYANDGYQCPIDRMIFWPKDPTDFLLPLWAAFPEQSRISSLWRQGAGEVYKERWSEWFVALSDEKKQAYEEQYPPPHDESLCFDDFYEYCRKWNR